MIATEINYIARQLNELDVNGEAMQQILEKTGMTYQMAHQLIMTLPMEYLNAEISERIELNKTQLNENTITN